MIHNQKFNCPKCGAPGEVVSGAATYSCMCRLGAYVAPANPAFTPVVTYYCGCPGDAPCQLTYCPRRATGSYSTVSEK